MSSLPFHVDEVECDFSSTFKTFVLRYWKAKFTHVFGPLECQVAFVLIEFFLYSGIGMSSLLMYSDN